MALIICFLFLFVFPVRINGQPPDPGFKPTEVCQPLPFGKMYKRLWGLNNQMLDHNKTLTMWLDRYSGSGIKSKYSYSAGIFAVDMKLPPGYTAGIDISFYLSSTPNYSKPHDELDFEFLGNIEGQPYVLQTNVLTRQTTTADGQVFGREQRSHLWFDPTLDFHQYAIIWNQMGITFLVDNIPIRYYPKKADRPFVTRTMWAYGSIWDASSWATDNGLYKANYSYAPFKVQYRSFRTCACHNTNTAACSLFSASPDGGFRLSQQQFRAMIWVRKHFMFYNYCKDRPSNSPEC